MRPLEFLSKPASHISPTPTPTRPPPRPANAADPLKSPPFRASRADLSQWLPIRPARNAASISHAHGCLTFYHPAMQEALLQAASEAGAEVRRGGTVSHVERGAPPQVNVPNGTGSERLRARLVMVADGRRSRGRDWLGLEVQRDPQRMQIAGLMMSGMLAEADARCDETTRQRLFGED
jgi:2-polyprenyl-6-methoxyphenol hydroxylase-like FAD-dependent oxidoreductase